MEIKQPGFKEAHPNSITFMIQHLQMHMQALAAMEAAAMKQRVQEALLIEGGKQELKPKPKGAGDKPAPSHTNDGGRD